MRYELLYPRVRYENFSSQHKKQLLQYELTKHQNNLKTIEQEISTHKQLFSEICNHHLRQSIETKLNEIYDQDLATAESRIINKLNNLYRGQINIPNHDINQYINLSQHELAKDQITILNLGTKFHFKPNFDPNQKKAELETLYSTLTSMHNNNLIHIHTNLKDLLRA